jgi:hypothetical protein
MSMYTDSDLEGAVAAGVLTPQAADAFRNHVAASRATPAVDEEHFRLLTGFNDIFVAIAAVILLIALAGIGNSIRFGLPPGAATPLAGSLVALAAWALAEFFTRERRMALPSIILLLAFVGGVFTAALAAVSTIFPAEAFQRNDAATALTTSGCAALAAAAAWLHWRRFRVPITVAAGAAALVAMALGFIGYLIGDGGEREALLIPALISGVAVFLLAMRWDASDPARQTGRSDVAFWLHLLAAPLIVHPVFSLLGLTDGSGTPIEAAVVLLVYVALGLTALAIDRRALLVSALAYVLFALTSLFRSVGAVELSFALTAFVIGSALLLLSAFWHTARRRVVEPLPATLKSKLPALDRAPSSRPAS